MLEKKKKKKKNTSLSKYNMLPSPPPPLKKKKHEHEHNTRTFSALISGRVYENRWRYLFRRTSKQSTTANNCFIIRFNLEHIIP